MEVDDEERSSKTSTSVGKRTILIERTNGLLFLSLGEIYEQRDNRGGDFISAISSKEMDLSLPLSLSLSLFLSLGGARGAIHDIENTRGLESVSYKQAPRRANGQFAIVRSSSLHERLDSSKLAGIQLPAFRKSVPAPVSRCCRQLASPSGAPSRLLPVSRR